MTQTVIATDIIKKGGRWIIKIQVPDWLLADLLTDQEKTSEQTPIILYTPYLAQSMYFGENNWHIDHSAQPHYIGSAKFEVFKQKKGNSYFDNRYPENPDGEDQWK